MFMNTAKDNVLVAPAKLLVSTRGDFRQKALQFVERRVVEGGEIVIDLSDTLEIDASGIGLLVLVQEWARRHDLVVRLLGVRKEVRDLLDLTRLDGLFVIE